MRNRFEQYINSGYQSQFVPTQLDSNLMLNTLKERQSVYDNLLAANANLMPQFDYIKPTDYDMGHSKEAMDVYNFYQDKTSEIATLLQDDNLEAAKSVMLNTISDKNMKRKIQYLQSAYNQDLSNLKSIEGIKNIGDRQTSLNHYYQNRLKDRNFEDFISGKSNPLMNPVLGDNPGLDRKALALGNAINSDGYTFADGSNLQRVKDNSGNYIYKMRYQTGDVKYIDKNEANSIIINGLMADPEVQQYASAMNQWGTPLMYKDDKGQIKGSLVDIANSVAEAVSFKDENIRSNYLSDEFGLKNYKNNFSNADSFIARTPVKNPNTTTSTTNDLKVENGKVYKKVITKVEGSGLPNPGGASGPITTNVATWQEYKPSNTEIDNFKKNYVKVIDPTNNLATVVPRWSNEAKTMQIQELDDVETIKAIAGYESSMQNVSYSTSKPLSDSKINSAQLAASGYNSGQWRKIGKDGSISYESNKVTDLPKNLEFYDSGFTIDHPEFGSGKQTFTATDEIGNIFELVTNTKVANNPIFDIVDEINNHVYSSDINDKAIKLPNNQFAIVNKNLRLQQNQQGNYDSQTTPQSNIIIVSGNNKEDAFNNYKNNNILATFPSGIFIENVINENIK